jgi:hypothetical protein
MPIKVWTRVAVTRLGRVAVLRILFAFYYRATWLIFYRISRFLFPEINSIKVHRGYASAGWEPGVSDIDVVLKISELIPDENACFTREWNRFYRVFRFLFPIMGEPIIATDREHALYYAWGDIRAFPMVIPSGPPSDVSEAKTALDLWTECLHAHTRLCKIAVSKNILPGPVLVRELRKCILDIARHSAVSPSRPPFTAVRSRLETENGLKSFKNFPASQLSEILQRALSSGTDTRECKHLAQLACAHTTNILEHDALRFLHCFNRFTGPAPAAALFAAPPRENDAALNMLSIFKKRFGDLFNSAILDNIFSSVVVLKDIPGAAEDLACGISILDCMAEWDPSMRGPVFMLGPKSLQLMGLGTYDDDPLKMSRPAALERTADSAVCLQSGAQAPFSIHRRFLLGAGGDGNAAPDSILLEALYRESLSHFLRTWRSLLPPGPGGPIYAVSRSVSLWLYFVKGMAYPCFPLQPLLETFKLERTPEDGAGLFEASLLNVLQPKDMEIISAVNSETLAAAERFVTA